MNEGVVELGMMNDDIKKECAEFWNRGMHVERVAII